MKDLSSFKSHEKNIKRKNIFQMIHKLQSVSVQDHKHISICLLRMFVFSFHQNIYMPISVLCLLYFVSVWVFVP